jgi:hypothetical protein
MADNVTLNAMTGGNTVAADEVVDGTLGTVKVQYVKLMDGTLDGTTKASVSSAGILTVERGSVIAHGSASVTTSAAQVLALATGRRSATIQNLGTDYIYLGATGITANNGLRLAPGQTVVIDKSPTAAIFAIAASGTQTVSYFTESD